VERASEGQKETKNKTYFIFFVCVSLSTAKTFLLLPHKLLSDMQKFSFSLSLSLFIFILVIFEFSCPVATDPLSLLSSFPLALSLSLSVRNVIKICKNRL
jgi:hypothetical protein